MTILGIEFSSAERSVALLQSTPAGSTVTRLVERGGYGRPLSLIDELLRKCGTDVRDVEVLALGLGPGSYTGVRSAISLAQGWQLARGTRLQGIGSADVLATQVATLGAAGFAIVVDAQRGEYYQTDYRQANAVPEIVGPLRIVPAAHVRETLAQGVPVYGPDIARVFAGATDTYPDATTLVRLAAANESYVAGENLSPIYLRETTFVKAPPPRII